MHCKICNSLSNFYFKKNILLKYDVSFFRCLNCGFLQTETPYWIDEAYESAMTTIDTGVMSRPLEMSRITERIILNYFNYESQFLDYGGGHGIFVRIMRDKGLNFYRKDKYAENIFARYFDFYDLPENDRKFELITCFEVLEHLEQPMDELSQIFNLGKALLCSTELQPFSSIKELSSWEYIGDLQQRLNKRW